MEAAKKLLADAGYPNGEGLPVLTFIVTNTKENKDIAQVIQSMWKDNLGVQADIVTFESKVYWESRRPETLMFALTDGPVTIWIRTQT